MKLIDLPKKIGASLYDETRKAVQETYAMIPGVTEVVEFGTIPLPGISDMDFIAAVEPCADMQMPSLKNFTEEQRYAMEHMHFVVSRDALTFLRYIDPWLFQVTPLLHEGSFSIEHVQELEEKDRHILSLSFITANHLLPALPTIGNIACTDTIHVRDFLELIKATNYCYRELHRANITEHASDPHAAPLIALREQWFELSEKERSERVEEALQAYQGSIATLLNILDACLQERCSLVQPPTKNLTPWQQSLLHTYPHSLGIDTGTVCYLFQRGREEMSVEYTLFSSPFSSQTYEQALCLLPLSVSAIQNFFLFEEGDMAEQYRKCFFTDLTEIPVVHHKALRKQAEVMEQIVQETKNVTGGKLLWLTYGYKTVGERVMRKHGTFRARWGGSYDRFMKSLVRGPLGRIVKQKRKSIVLDTPAVI